MIPTPQTPRGSDRTASPARHYPRAQPRRQVFPWQLEPAPLCRRGKSIASRVHPIGLTLPQNCRACQPAYAHYFNRVDPFALPATPESIWGPTAVRPCGRQRGQSPTRRRARAGRYTVVNALDTLLLMGLDTEYARVRACGSRTSCRSTARGTTARLSEARRNSPSYLKQGVNYARSLLNWGPAPFLNAVTKRGAGAQATAIPARQSSRRKPLAPQTPRASPRTPNLACLSPRYKPPDAIPARQSSSRKTRAHNPARLTLLAHPSAADPAHAASPARHYPRPQPRRQVPAHCAFDTPRDPTTRPHLRPPTSARQTPHGLRALSAACSLLADARYLSPLIATHPLAAAPPATKVGWALQHRSIRPTPSPRALTPVLRSPAFTRCLSPRTPARWCGSSTWTPRSSPPRPPSHVLDAAADVACAWRAAPPAYTTVPDIQQLAKEPTGAFSVPEALALESPPLHAPLLVPEHLHPPVRRPRLAPRAQSTLGVAAERRNSTLACLE
ncbi:hypothetical protein DFH07DRAFT_964891 [Mycena maculata]|uniref:Uncharacterized protein n=1 Tax=Mycena maculata TaxID=230809 RepID=A0AAD7IFN8_9AGAR|nr:hypothetical protein DFH07DRAFT_964891 [Mycena maculata]